jgi:hypothetical protein
MGKASAPPEPNYGKMTSETLAAQIKYAPDLYRVSAEYQPKYTELAGREYNTFLNAITPNYTQNVMPQMAEASRVANSAQRSADIGDISNLGPLARLALRNSDPDSARLLDRLNRQASEGMDAGAMLTGDEMRNLNNSLRSSMGARGISYGPASSYEEALASSQYGQQLKNQRQQSALAALGANRIFYGDPWQQVLGRPSQAFNSIGTLGAQAGQGVAGAGPSLFNPNAANQMYAGWQQAVGQTNAANASMTGSIIGGGLSALGSLGGAWIGR